MLAIDHNKLRTTANFQRVYKWNIAFINNSNLPDVVKALIGSDGENLNARCETATLPNRADQTIEVSIRGFKVKQPGIPDYGGPLALAFVEDASGLVIPAFRAWSQKCWEDVTGIQQLKQEMCADIRLELLNTKNEVVQGFVLYSCWPSDMTPGDLSGDGSDVLRPAVSLTYDYHTHFHGAAPSA